MKKLTTILAVFAMVICLLLSCGYEGTYEDGYDEGYDDGYYEGYSAGYYEGIAEAQHDIAFYVDDDLSSLAFDIEDIYGIHPEDALMILSNYADVPDEVDEKELNDAIWSICRYYDKSHEIINGIEDYWID